MLPVLQERLKQQKEEAQSNPDYDKSFKGQLSKEEKKAKRKQILSNIGVLPSMHTPAPQLKSWPEGDNSLIQSQPCVLRHVEESAPKHLRHLLRALWI